VSLPSHLQGLNPEQLEAASHLQGPLLVLAGAGSGKTRVLTRRVAHLIHSGVPPYRILAVTFTNKAAGEMRERVAELVGDAARDIVVSTFHSACARFLRRDAPRLGYTSSFVIYDTDDQQRVLRDILRELQIDHKRYPPKAYLSRIDQAKNRLLDPDDVANGLLGEPGAMAMRLDEVYAGYQRALKAANAFDFNDLVGRMVELLETDTELRERYRDRFQYLLVDEYQDTNHAQYRLIKALAGREPHNLAVVGDDDQSIYAFRGADIRNILDFERDFPQVKTIRLERNYRSTGNILELAGTLVRHNAQRKDKTLWTEAPAGDPVYAVVGADEEDEAVQVVDEIGRQMRSGRRPGDVAIFYRTHAASRPLEQALGKARIPHVVVGGRRFYERREVRDMVAWLRLLVNPTDTMAFLRIVNVPPRGIGSTTVGRLRARAEDDGVPVLEAAKRAAKEKGRAAKALRGFVELYEGLVQDSLDMSTPQLVMQIAERSGYVEALRAEDTLEARGRLENIDALARAARSAGDELPEDTPPAERLRLFLDQACLASADQDLPDHDGQVTLMTVHLAKGLEFPLVFVVGLVEKVFPHARSEERIEDIEEERRLAYVAFTRARERLYLCRPSRRWVRDGSGWSGGGRIAPARPSPFLRELPGRLIEPLGGRPGFIAGRARPTPPPVPKASTRKLDALLAQVRARQAPASVPPSGGGETTLVPDSPDVFQPGVRVRHPVFGDGEVRSLEGRGPALKVVVLFARFGRKKLRVRDARLEVLLD
jgi:DNA helicase-2/ATP-dependent DNA helicase PcrA